VSGPASGHHDVAILGAGAGGLATAIALRRASFDDFAVFEKSDGVGGTWRANTYPGAACDVPSHLYSFSFAPNPHWSRSYATQPEILDYLEACTDRFGIRPHLHCNTAITEARWSDDEGLWQLTAASGASFTARVVVSAVGMLSVPAHPDIPGLTDFEGPMFHSARWDHDIELAGKRVAVIGTGASAVQFIPQIASETERLTVFQRSAPWVLPRRDRGFTEQEQRRFAEQPWRARLLRWQLYWGYERATTFRTGDQRQPALAAFAESYRQRRIPDPDLRRALTPDYPAGCKRVLISSDFYPALSRDDVELVTTPIHRITRNAVVTAGRDRHLADAIILGTGFRATDYLRGVEVYGSDGRHLHDEWRDGAHAHLGITVAGYPNFFMVYGPNTNQGGNSIIFLLEAQAAYIVRALRALRRRRVDVVEVRRKAMERYNAKLSEELAETVWHSCESYFKTPGGRIVTQLPHRSSWYWLRTRRFSWRDHDGRRVAARSARRWRSARTEAAR
jgi:cation diffusion facilitator CzcD-associated flavoprotein CzcO